MSIQPDNGKNDEGEKSATSATFVKVSMDAAPYLCKVHWKMYRSYQKLSAALHNCSAPVPLGIVVPKR